MDKDGCYRNTEEDFRKVNANEPKLLKKMVAHVGHCEECGGDYVKMVRGRELQLLPDDCRCINCGQRYYMEIPDIESWEIEQWKQKGQVG